VSLLRKLLFSLVASAFVLILAEVGLRVAGYPPVAENPRFEHNSVYWIQDPDQKATEVAHRETRGSFLVSTDERGLRTPIHGPEKPAGMKRVMTLGCSTTFGWGVDDAESYPARLEHYLHEMGHDAVEVINGGQPGYTTFQGLWLWEEVLKDYAPDVVIVGYVVQDARRVAYSDVSQALIQEDAAFLKNNILYRIQLYKALRNLLGRVQTQAKDEQQEVFRVDDKNYLESLRTFKDKIEGVGAAPVYFGFPLERVGYTELHRNIMTAAAKADGVPHFDPSVEIEAMTRNETLYFPQDRGHANAAGCDTIGRMMADFLVDQGLVP